MRDYETSGMDVQWAMVDMVRQHPDKETRPDYILWGGQQVRTSHWLSVPNDFRIALDFLSEPDADQGADIRVDEGYLTLAAGEKVSLLRTWHDPEYEPRVEYPGHSRTGRVAVYNVSRVERAGMFSEEKWTGNAGMLVEQVGPGQWLYRCSSAHCRPPDFGSIVFGVTISPLDETGRTQVA